MSHEHVKAGIVHWSLFIVEHDNHFQWWWNKACASGLLAERIVLKRDSEKLSSRTDSCEESRKSTELESNRLGHRQLNKKGAR